MKEATASNFIPLFKKVTEVNELFADICYMMYVDCEMLRAVTYMIKYSNYSKMLI